MRAVVALVALVAMAGSAAADKAADNLEAVIKANREWWSGSLEIVTQRTGNSVKIVQGAARSFVDADKNVAEKVAEKAEEAVETATKIVEEAAA